MSEMFPAGTIAIEYFSCTDASRLYEFNRWFNTVRIPQLLQIPGIISVTRYRNMQHHLSENQPQFMAVYRLDSDNPRQLMQNVAQGQTIDCLHSYRTGVWDFIAMRTSVKPPLRPPSRLPDGMPDVLLVVPTSCTDPARLTEFNQWYLFTHFHDILETPGLVQASRYRSLNPNPESHEAAFLALYEIESDDPAAVVRQIQTDDSEKRIPQGRMIDCIRLQFGSGTFEHVDL